ncbi:hypothetical protein D3C72_761500 [compost metagenome]
MIGDDDGAPRPDGAVCTCAPRLVEQIAELGADEFYVQLDLDSPSVDGSIRVVAITPKPKK